MTKQPNTPKRFTRAIDAALLLPTPRELYLRILSSTTGADNGLRAASYEARVSGSRGGLTQPERLAEARIGGSEKRGKRHPDGLDDLIAVNRAGTKALDAIDAIAAQCLDIGTSEGWEDALQTAHLLAETVHADTTHDHARCDCTSRLEDGLAVGYHLDGWVRQLSDSIAALRTIQRRYSRRAPTRWEQVSESGVRADRICDICASLTPPVYIEARNRARLTCRHCNDLWLEAGERPPREVKQAFHHGTQTEYRRLLSAWHRELAEDRRRNCA